MTESKSLLSSASSGDTAAMYLLGWEFFIGGTNSEDKNQAFRWFYMAASQGHIGAQYMLGWIYYFGYGTPRDERQFMYWFCTASSNGHIVAKSSLDTIRRYRWVR